MSIDEAGDVHIWTVRPKDVEPAQWPQLTAWLDAPALVCAARFRHDEDRRAYVLAHALRRLAVASILAVPPVSLAFSSEASGRPFLTVPPDQAIHFSHSRSRTLVVCAVTRIGPVGIDAEPLEQGNADMALLHGLIALPDAQHRHAAPGSDHTQQFFFYWTLLEAFWKSRGRGLSFDHPMLHCQPTPQGWFEVSTSQAGAGGHDGRGKRTWATALQGPPGCAITLAVTAHLAHAAISALRLTHHTPVFEPVSATQDSRPQKPRSSHRPCPPNAPANAASSVQAAPCVSA